MNILWIKNLSRAGLIAGTLVFLGILLAVTIDMRFLIITGLGAFGPGFLRELGILRDQDEFARLANYRAGYIASLFAGSTAILIIAFLKAGSVDLEGESLALAIILSILWLVTVFTSLQKFWGIQKAVFRILTVFGTFWLIFILLSHFQEPVSMLMESLVVLPFFLLAWMSRRWPRIAGAVIIVLGIFCFFLFRLYSAASDEKILVNIMVFILFICPLLVTGTALVALKPDEEEIIANKGG
ncbi:MAG: hypothetical protein K9N35_12440 [Candidatus Marinimicrobia bacterium]|nr:hypothetical protein [Candidatus Neomarinimicrobiota bacterium]